MLKKTEYYCQDYSKPYRRRGFMNFFAQRICNSQGRWLHSYAASGKLG